MDTVQLTASTTGMLDLMTNRSEFLEAARRFKGTILVVYGAGTPRRSKAEMQALAALPNVRSVALPSGKLGIHEEFPDEVAEAVRSFLCAVDWTPGSEVAS